MIRYLHSHAAVFDGGDGQLRSHHAFQQHGQTRRFAYEFDIVPIQIALDGFLAIPARLSGKISVGERRAEMIAAVGFAIAGDDRVDGEDDGGVARGFRAAENYGSGASIGREINLKPFRAGTGLCDFFERFG